MVLKGDHERRLTLAYMRRYGYNAVRGSAWCRDIITEPLELWALTIAEGGEPDCPELGVFSVPVRSPVDQHVAGEYKSNMSVTPLANTSLADWSIGPAQKNPRTGANEWHICLKNTRQPT